MTKSRRRRLPTMGHFRYRPETRRDATRVNAITCKLGSAWQELIQSRGNSNRNLSSDLNFAFFFPHSTVSLSRHSLLSPTSPPPFPSHLACRHTLALACPGPLRPLGKSPRLSSCFSLLLIEVPFALLAGPSRPRSLVPLALARWSLSPSLVGPSRPRSPVPHALARWSLTPSLASPSRRRSLVALAPARRSLLPSFAGGSRPHSAVPPSALDCLLALWCDAGTAALHHNKVLLNFRYVRSRGSELRVGLSQR